MSLSFEAYKKIKDKEIDERNERMANVKAQREAEKKEREAQQKAAKKESTIKATAGEKFLIKAGPIQNPLFSVEKTERKPLSEGRKAQFQDSFKKTQQARKYSNEGRKAQFQDSFQKNQQERWDKEAKAREEEEKAEKRQNAMKYINSEGGITPDNFMEIKPYKNTYSDAAVRSAENMKNQLEKQAAELQKEIEYSRIRHEAMTKNGSFENAKKEKAYKDKLEENLSKLNKEINYYNDVIGIKATDRVSNAVNGIVNSTIATAGVLGETAKTALKDTAANVKNDELQELRKEYRIKESELNRLKNYGFINPEDAEKDKEYLAKKAELEEMAAEIENMTQKTAVDMNSPYMKNYGAAQSYTQKATEGLEGATKVIADTAISALDNLILYPTAAISPAIPISIMGAKASAAKAYELSDRGISAGETLIRALASGGVEAVTEKIPLENLADMVKVGGNSVVKNLLRQSGLEATEEGLSYLGNYIIDMAAKDPEANFSIQDFALSVLMGGLSGLFFGAGGSVIDTAVNGRRTVEGTVPTQKVYEGVDTSTYLTPEKELVMQYMNRPRRSVTNNMAENVTNSTEATNNMVENSSNIINNAENNSLYETEVKENVNTPEEVSLEKISRKINAQQDTEAFQRGIRPLLQEDLKIDTERMDNIAQRIGSNVKYFLGENSDIEGFYENGDIYLNIRSLTGDFNTDAWRIFKHEFTHSLENTKSYGKFAREIQNTRMFEDFLREEGYIDESGNTDIEWFHDDIRERYEENGIELNNTDLSKEVIARFVENSDIFTNEKSIRRLTEEKPSLARDILNWIRDTIAKIRNTFKKDEGAEELLKRAENYYMKALFEAERRGTKAAEEKQYSIETDSKGRQYVKESRNVPLGKDANNWHNEAGNFINDEILKKGNNGVLQVISADGDVLTIDNLTAYKLEGRDTISSNGSPRLQTDQEYERKLRMAGHIDELAQVSKLKNKTPVPDTKNHLFAKDGFNYRKAYYEDSNGDYYELTVSAGKNGNVETVYNINKIRTRKNPNQKRNSAVFTGSSFQGKGAQNSTVSNNNISQQASNSNTGNGNVTNSNSTVQHSIRRRKKDTSKEQIESQKTVNAEGKSETEDIARRGAYIFLRDLKKDLGLKRFKSANELKKIFSAAFEDYIETGEIDNEKAEKLFKGIYDSGRVINEYYEENRDLKNKLRKTQIYAGNVPDRAKYYGKLFITKNKRALKADSFYMELSEQYPELFPKNITNIEDQLDKMTEVIEEVGYPEKAYSDASSKEEMEVARERFNSGLENAKAYLWEQAEKKARTKERVQERQKALENARKAIENPKYIRDINEARRKFTNEYNRLKKKEIITSKEEDIMKEIYDGKRSIDSLPEGVNHGGIKNVYEAYKEKRKAEEAIIKFKEKKSEANRKLASEALKNSDKWKDKELFGGYRYSMETMERNIEDITKDAYKGQRKNEDSDFIIKNYFEQIHKNEADKNRFIKEVSDKIRNLKLGRRKKYTANYISADKKAVKADVSESELVMLYGEGVMNEIQLKQTGADVEKIKKAANVFRGIYDEIEKTVNEVLMRNGYPPIGHINKYFPHYFEDKPDTVLEKIGDLVGIDIMRKELPTDIAGMTHTFKPGKRWVGNFQKRTGNATEYDALKGFDRYIGGVADVIFHTDDIQKLRALETEARYKYSEKGIQERIDEIRKNPNLDKETKEANIKDILEKKRLSHLPHFVTELRNYTDSLAGKKDINDRTMEHNLGRAAYNVMTTIERKVGANMVAINPGSWLTNVIPVTQVSGVVKLGSLFKAFGDTNANLIRTITGEGNDGFRVKSDFLVNRRGNEPVYKTAGDILQNILTKPFSGIDNWTSEVVVRSLYYDKLRKGSNEFEAMDYANDMAARIMADRSLGAQPTIFNQKNPITKLFTMFQLEVNNQYRFLFKDIPKEEKKILSASIAWGLLKIAIGAWLYNQLYSLLTGRDAATDIFSMGQDTFLDFKNSDLKASEKVLRAIDRVGEEIPFVGGVLFGGGRLPIESAVPSGEKILASIAAVKSGETDIKRAKEVIGDELKKPLAYTVLPYGGGQLKKTGEAIKLLKDGEEYSYDKSGEKKLKYVIEDPSGFDKFRAVAFGKSSLPEYREWGERNFKSLSVNQTKNYYKSVEAGISYSQYMTALDKTSGLNSDKDSKGNTINPDTTAEHRGEGKSASLKKKEAIDSIEGLSKKQKEVLYEAMEVSKKLWK